MTRFLLSRLGILVGLMALFGASCRSPGANIGLTTVESQDGFTLNTSQKCQAGREVVKVADLALSLAIRHSAELGYLEYSAAAESIRDKLMLCLIEDPEPFRVGSATVGPCKGSVCARKAGCASDSTAWAAKKWPPVCAESWPEEPHCLPADSWRLEDGYDWRSTLVHEVVNLVAQRLTNVRDPSYQDKFYGAGGPDQLTARDWIKLTGNK